MSAVETLLPEETEETEIGIMTMRDEIRRQVLATIRGLHQQAGGLSRIHRTHPALYAQARRAFGSWREAVAAAGLDYGHELHQSLRRGLLLRDQRRALWRALSRFLLWSTPRRTTRPSRPPVPSWRAGSGAAGAGWRRP